MPNLDTSSPSSSVPRSWVVPPDAQSPAINERDSIELKRQSSGRTARRQSIAPHDAAPSHHLAAQPAHHAFGTLPPRRPPLRPLIKNSTDSLASPQHSYVSSRRNALGSPGTTFVPIFENDSQEVLSPLSRESMGRAPRRGSMPSPEREGALRSPRQLRPLQLVSALGSVPPTPYVDGQSPVGQICVCPLHPRALPPPPAPAPLAPMTEEARVALELVTGRRAGFWPSVHILSIPTLGLAGKLIIAVGLSRVVLAQALHEEDSTETLKWWGIMGIGCFALVYSIFAGSFHVNHFSPTAAWTLGAASLASAVVFNVGEWMIVEGTLRHNSALFNGGAAVTGIGLGAASLCNFTYFAHGELHHGFVPIPRRVLTSSVLGALVGVSSAVYTLTSVSRRDGVAVRDTVASALLLLLLLALMLNFSYGMRGFISLRARRNLEEGLGGEPQRLLEQPPDATVAPAQTVAQPAMARAPHASPPSYFAYNPRH